jgi:hypothetical protein
MVKQVTYLARLGKATRFRLAIAVSLGMISILGGLLLATADAVRGSVTWAHHSPMSAAPLFLIAAAIATISIGRQPDGRHGLLRLVAVLAFTAWGTAQLMPNPAAAGALNDAAILLFVIDGGCAVASEARTIAASRKQPAQATSLQHDPQRPQPAAPQHDGASTGQNYLARPCCGRPVQQCACIGACR